jgi:hypothetical protein
LSAAYADLRARIDQIVTQAEQQGSLAVAISGLNSIRQTLDSLSRLAGLVGPAAAQVNVAVQTNVAVDLKQIADRMRRGNGWRRTGRYARSPTPARPSAWGRR